MKFIRGIEKLKKILKIGIQSRKDDDYYLTIENHLHPVKESSIAVTIYILAGVIWMSFSDELISAILHIRLDYRIINVMKGWSFVVISAFVIFGFLLRRLLMFQGALNNLGTNLNRQRAIEIDLYHMAYYDILTGLPNRYHLEEKCRKLTGSQYSRFAFIYLDVDDFKNINDTLGHIAGDHLLIYLSKLLIDFIGKEDFVARVGGDEFIILLNYALNKEEVEKQLRQLLELLKETWNYGGQKFNISVSMGVALYPEHGDDISLLLKNADISMYAVKKNRKNSYCFYSEELTQNNLRNIRMINELHRAIENEEFILLYQPIINLETGRMSGVEALIRWKHPEHGMISPMDFIPLAEESGLIHEMEAWILRTAFYQKKAWVDKLSGYGNLVMSINISGKSFLQYGFVNSIRNLLMETGINSNEIQIEITETVFIEKMNISKKVISDISNMGIQIALDDFGSGYSSLTYLKSLPIDVVKLDANFIRGINNHGEDRVIVKSVTELTHNLGLRIVAEGIETQSQLSILSENKCDLGQGYLFSKPVTADAIEKLIRNKEDIMCIAN